MNATQMDSSIGDANSMTHTAYENTGISILRAYAQEKRKEINSQMRRKRQFLRQNRPWPVLTDQRRTEISSEMMDDWSRSRWGHQLCCITVREIPGTDRRY